MIRVAGNHIVVAGAARSGIAAAQLLRFKGAKVLLTDSGAIDPVLEEQLQQQGIDVEQKGHSELAYEGDFLVVSPGVPTQTPLVQSYLQGGKQVFSELEVASWFNEAPEIAVTGTNGKTTVTSWLDHLWGLSTRPYIVAGNIGMAYSGLLIQRSEPIEALLEVSSFQLDHIDAFKPKIAALLNISPDHLDRYDMQFEAYAAAKYRLFENQDEHDFLVYNVDDTQVSAAIDKHKEKEGTQPKYLAFSLNNDHGLEGAFVDQGQIMLRFDGRLQSVMPIREVGLRGDHNLANALAVLLIAFAAEQPMNIIRESLQRFSGVAHRLEKVRLLNGVQFINDSKATNIQSVWYALSAFHQPVILLLGGRDKGNNWRELFPQLQNKVHTIIAFGEAREKIAYELEFMVPNLIQAKDLVEGVHLAREQAKAGEIVLLSPACASFDQYKNYEERGQHFKQLVGSLSERIDQQEGQI